MSAIKNIMSNKEKANNIMNIIKKTNTTTIIDKIPAQNRIRSKVSDMLDLSELSHIEAQIEEHSKRHK